jgi:tRNA threonylcarbamoyladenosine biosynthesis protein TsaB
LRLLGLDTSTPSTVVGLLLDDGSVLEAYDDPGAHGRPGHQARLLPLAAELLARAGTDWRELDRVAVGLGPGTYTGLRVGVATARGVAESLAIEIVGVSSSLALAHAALRAADRGGCVITIVDARRGELFIGGYCAVEGSAEPQVPTVLSPLRPVPVGDVAAAIAEIVAHDGVDADISWLAVGDGVAKVGAAVLASTGVRVSSEAAAPRRPGAVALCELAARMPAQPLETVAPEYRRPADAELAAGAGAGGHANGRAGERSPQQRAVGASPAALAGRAAG